MKLKKEKEIKDTIFYIFVKKWMQKYLDPVSTMLEIGPRSRTERINQSHLNNSVTWSLRLVNSISIRDLRSICIVDTGSYKACITWHLFSCWSARLATLQLPISHSQRLNSGKSLSTGCCEWLWLIAMWTNEMLLIALPF